MAKKKKLPTVLILGRPNVGKSTFLNRVLGKQKAITLDKPGVTRDVSTHKVTWNNKTFFLADSAGVILSNPDDFQAKMDERAMAVAETAHKILFMTDARAGVHPVDTYIADTLRPFADKVVVMANKVDGPEQGYLTDEFFQLGLGEPTPISSVHGRGIPDVLNRVTDDMSEVEDDTPDTFRVSIVGRPNVGKSSLLNTLINEERVLVANEAGTTRDSTEAYFEYKGSRFVFVDTAGIRRNAKIKESIEFYSVVRSQKSIAEADIVIFLTDVDGFLCDQDRRLLSLLRNEGKSFIVAINKWDLTTRTSHERNRLIKAARVELPFLAYYPIITLSAKERVNIGKLYSEIPAVASTGKKRVGTGVFNRFVTSIIKASPAYMRKGQRLKIYYGTQAETTPPTFVFFVNNASAISDDFTRFVERRIREHLDPYIGHTIQVHFKSSHSERD